MERGMVQEIATKAGLSYAMFWMILTKGMRIRRFSNSSN
jgi:hypothetical protein